MSLRTLYKPTWRHKPLYTITLTQTQKIIPNVGPEFLTLWAVFGFSNMVRNSGPTLGIIFWVWVRVMVYNGLWRHVGMYKVRSDILKSFRYFESDIETLPIWIMMMCDPYMYPADVQYVSAEFFVVKILTYRLFDEDKIKNLNSCVWSKKCLSVCGSNDDFWFLCGWNMH